MTRKEILRGVKHIIATHLARATWESTDDGDGEVRRVYIGSALSLDPCGKYHHMLSPNGVTVKCKRFWSNLESVCDELHVSLESGESDALDQFIAEYRTKAESEED